jgi:hypothetical protein
MAANCSFVVTPAPDFFLLRKIHTRREGIHRAMSLYVIALVSAVDFKKELCMDDLLGNVKAGDTFFAERPPSLNTITSLVCLNFKVPMRVRQQFKVYAARHNMTMTELLLRLIDDNLTPGVLAAGPTRSQDKK